MGGQGVRCGWGSQRGRWGEEILGRGPHALDALDASGESRSIWPRHDPLPLRHEEAPPPFTEAGLHDTSRRRPTLAGPFVQLPSALQRFTSGFGTGPGGATVLWPPGLELIHFGCFRFLSARTPFGRGGMFPFLLSGSKPDIRVAVLRFSVTCFVVLPVSHSIFPSQAIEAIGVKVKSFGF